jgi:hypothetical protein
MPVYCKTILKDGSLSGYMLAGSNFGEFAGGFLVAFLSAKVPNFMIYA